MCEETDINPWERAYRRVIVKLKRSRALQIKCPVLSRRIVITLFSPQSKCVIATERDHPSKDIPNITDDGLTITYEKLGAKKISALNGIPNITLMAAI